MNWDTGPDPQSAPSEKSDDTDALGRQRQRPPRGP